MAGEQRWISTTFLAWSWFYTPGELLIVYPWKTDCIDGPMNGRSGSRFYMVILPLQVGSASTLQVESLSHCLNLSCPVICFGQNKEMAEATSYLVLIFFFFCIWLLRGPFDSTVSWEHTTSRKTGLAHPAGKRDPWLCTPYPTLSTIADQQTCQWIHPGPASSQLIS